MENSTLQKTLVMDAQPETVKQSCDRSLQRLGVDYIDLYYLHRVDPQVHIEDTALSPTSNF